MYPTSLIECGKHLQRSAQRVVGNAVAGSLMTVATKRLGIGDLGSEFIQLIFEAIGAIIKVTDFWNQGNDNVWSNNREEGFEVSPTFFVGAGIKNGTMHNLPLLEFTFVSILF